MLFLVIKLYKWQLAPESITSPPLAVIHTAQNWSAPARRVRMRAIAGVKKIANKKLLHCLNNDGVIITHKNQHDRDASFKL